MTADSPNLSKTDLHILVILADQTLWKKRIHKTLQEHGTDDTAVSVQTVGRYVDRLRENDLLDIRLVNPDNVSRSVIAAYTTTEKGDRALNRYRVCEGCGELVGAEDHTHCLTEAGAYFSAPS